MGFPFTLLLPPSLPLSCISPCLLFSFCSLYPFPLRSLVDFRSSSLSYFLLTCCFTTLGFSPVSLHSLLFHLPLPQPHVLSSSSSSSSSSSRCFYSLHLGREMTIWSAALFTYSYNSVLISSPNKMTLSVCVCLQKVLQLKSDEHIFKFIKSKFALGQTRYEHTQTHSRASVLVPSHTTLLQSPGTRTCSNTSHTQSLRHLHTSWLDLAWLYYSLSTGVVAPGVLVCVNNRWRGNASRPPINQRVCVCVRWAAQPLESCFGVADNTAHNPAPHNWPFNYSEGLWEMQCLLCALSLPLPLLLCLSLSRWDSFLLSIRVLLFLSLEFCSVFCEIPILCSITYQHVCVSEAVKNKSL